MNVKKLIVLSNLVMIVFWGLNSYAGDKSNQRKSVSEVTKKALILTLEANEDLHNAFFNYDGKKVEASAKKLKEKYGIAHRRLRFIENVRFFSGFEEIK